MTGVIGRVLDAQGRPAAGTSVYAYRSERAGLRGPADFSARADDKGDYFLDLVEGRYWLVARQRLGRGDSGPPRIGDGWAPFVRNPVLVQAGASSRADFLLQTIAQPQVMRQGTLTEGKTGFRGRLVDDSGQSVVGAFALAYLGQDQRRMPDHTSLAVGADGRFRLFVAEPGEYCLAARTRTRGQPLAGEPYGRLGRGAAGCRQVAAGELLDIGRIVLRPFQP